VLKNLVCIVIQDALSGFVLPRKNVVYAGG